MSDFWQSEEDEGEFRDVPDEVVEGQSAPPAQVRQSRPTAAQQVQLQGTLTPNLNPQVPVQEDQSQDSEEAVQEEDFSSVLSDAKLRLAQGSLYEMLMNNNLFENMEGVDPRAVKNVEREVMNFAKERMEIMLGMRQEATQEPSMSASSFPFNDLEVEALKAIASAATKGATQAPEAQQFTAASSAPAPRPGLKTISLKSPSRPAVTQKAPAPAAPAKPLAQKPATPVTKNKRTEAQIEQILAEEGISREEYERQYNPNYKPLTKPVSQMNEAELKEWKRQDALKTHKQVKSPAAIPMPTAEQEEMMYSQRAQAANAHPQMQTIMGLLTQKKK